MRKTVGQEPELPSFHDLVHRFSLFDSAASSSRCDVQIGPNGSLFCNCEGCIRWRDFLEGRDAADAHVKYEVFTREHVIGLAFYLRARAAEYNLSFMDVLEVGAGNGRLSHHLNRFLSRLLSEKQGPVVRVIATDSGARGLNGPAVKEEDALHAITTRKPHIIISSWMPRGIDWTAHMKAEPSVREYILIGETDNGICGCPWQTWGFSSACNWSESSSDDDSDCDDSENSHLQPEVASMMHSKTSTAAATALATVTTVAVIGKNQGLVASGGRTTSETPPYERDGWERVELDSLSRVQLCRTDERWSTSRHSHTVSFRKK